MELDNVLKAVKMLIAEVLYVCFLSTVFFTI